MLLMIAPVGMSQDNFTLSGYIRDASSGESLIGATVYVKQLNSGTVSNAYGFYSLTLPKGSYELGFTYIGYSPLRKSVDIQGDVTLSIDLELQSEALEEVIIQAERADHNIRSATMGVDKLTPKEIKSIPVILGEQDVLKTIQLLPGVRGGNEGGTGFHVRGGGADQNLILLDEAPVYNAGHLLGFFSVFNSDAINDFTLYKGNAPSNYGGRLSSVLDVRMKEGNVKKTAISGGLGLISSRLTIETPIVKDKSSLMISGRRTYADLLLNLTDNSALKNTTLYFYDLNAKANYRINDNNRLFISGYLGQDVCRMVQVNNSGTRMNFGNITASARWNHVFDSKKLFSNTTFIYSKYSYLVGVSSKNISSSIEDYNFKEDFSYFPSPSNSVKFGVNIMRHTFRPGEISNEGSEPVSKPMNDKYALECGAYVSHEAKIGHRFALEYGLRFSSFSLMGPGIFYTYNPNGEVIDSASYGNSMVVKTYTGFEPRISGSFTISSSSSFKASYARNRQYIHLVSNSTSTSNFDIWQPSTTNVLPEVADQFALGYFKNFDNNQYEASVEAYYKYLQHQIEYRDGANVLFSSDVEREYVYGKGQAYGLELYLKKKQGKLTGWISYTLGRTERRFDQINNGKAFAAKYDRTHDISVVGIYSFTKRLSVSGSWVYYTGNAVTYPCGKYYIQDITTPLYSERNAQRMPDYHRLDLGLTLEGKHNDEKRVKSTWNFSIYNAYARSNPYTINFRSDELNPDRTVAIQSSMFSIVPAITYNFKF